MPRLLSKILVVHWAAVFSLLAVITVFGGEARLSAGMSVLGLEVIAGEYSILSPIAVRAMLAFGLTVSAVLFWWAALTLTFAGRSSRADGDAVMKAAFACSTGFLTVVLLHGIACGHVGILPVITAHFAALVASYVAIQFDGEPKPAPEAQTEDMRLAARVRALDASQTAMLSRFGAPRTPPAGGPKKRGGR